MQPRENRLFYLETEETIELVDQILLHSNKLFLSLLQDPTLRYLDVELASLVFGDKTDRRKSLSKCSLETLKLILSILSSPKDWNYDLQSVLKFLAPKLSKIDYDSFQIFNSIFASHSSDDISLSYGELLDNWKVPSLLFKNKSSECFGFAIRAKEYFQSLGIQAIIYGVLLNEELIHDDIAFDHIAVCIKDEDHSLLLEPFYNFESPIDLKSTSQLQRRDGKVFTVNTFKDSILLSRVDKDIQRTYLPVSDSDIILTLKKLVKLSSKEYLYVHQNNKTPVFVRYDPKKQYFVTNIPDLPIIPPDREHILKNYQILSEYFESSKIIAILINFINILNTLPKPYWTK
jgi:hypothetical protein